MEKEVEAEALATAEASEARDGIALGTAEGRSVADSSSMTAGPGELTVVLEATVLPVVTVPRVTSLLAETISLPTATPPNENWNALSTEGSMKVSGDLEDRDVPPYVETSLGNSSESEDDKELLEETALALDLLAGVAQSMGYVPMLLPASSSGEEKEEEGEGKGKGKRKRAKGKGERKTSKKMMLKWIGENVELDQERK